jgi:hypothetical protein
MLRFIAAAILGFFLFGSESASAQAGDCAANCDFYHNYGPYDFSYIRPGLTGYPVCDRRGNCLPYLRYYVYGRPVGRITIRPLGKKASQRAR